MNREPKYFLYARKSTEDDDRQVMSIEAQLFELREHARKENLEILAEFQESKSAKTPGREVFNEMMTRIEVGEAQGILAWHPDRLARNSIDGGRVIYAVDTGKVVSLRFPTFWFSPTPQGLFMLQVAFGQSKYYSDNLSENIKRGIRQKLRRGEWLNLAPFGYQNNPRTHNIEPHPTNARIVKIAYEEYAKGSYGFEPLARFLATLGVVSKNQTPPAKVSIKRLLTHRVYLGFVKHGDEWFEGNFEPIISPTLFEAVQKVLRAKDRPRSRRQKHDFPLTGLFKCAECDSMISAQWATGKSGGRYRYYRCSKKRGACTQPYVQEAELARKIQEQLQTISLPERYTDWMLEQVEKEDKETVSAHKSEIQHLCVRIKADEERMEKLVSLYLDGDIPKEAYLTKKDTLMRSLAASRGNMKDVAGGTNNRNEPLRNWILDLKQANILASSDNLPKLKQFVLKVGTNPTLDDKSPCFSVATPFQFVALRRGFLPACVSAAPSARLTSVISEQEVSICGEYGI
jgi:site-specific DNA recombinase